MRRLSVTADRGLNVRRFPEHLAEAMVGLPFGMTVELLDPEPWRERWMRIRAKFSDAYSVEGYVERTWLEPLDDKGEPERLADAPVLPAVHLHDLTPPETRRRHIDELHPDFRNRMSELMERLKPKGLRFKIFEAYRTPARQNWLYAQGRTRALDQSKITYVGPWASMHNYGLAVDLVLDYPGVNLWEERKLDGVDYGAKWHQMRDIAVKCGLHVLKKDGKPWDLGHLQMAGCTSKELQEDKLPAGGDRSWAENLARMASSFAAGAPSFRSLEALVSRGAAFLIEPDVRSAEQLSTARSDQLVVEPEPAPQTGGQGAFGTAISGAAETVSAGIRAIGDMFSPTVVSGFFHPSAQNNIDRYLPLLLEELAAAGLDKAEHVITALGTVNAESAGFQPIDEGVSRYNTEPGGPPFGKYDERSDLGNRGHPDGERFKGRGFIQLTGRANYETYGEKLGIPLAEQPELANDPRIAAKLLARFLADKKEIIDIAWRAGNWKMARAAVNGGDHGIDRFVEVVEGACALGMAEPGEPQDVSQPRYFQDYRDALASWDKDRWPNFKPSEFRCKTCGEYMHDPVFLDAISSLRRDLGKPMTVVFGTRCANGHHADACAHSEHTPTSVAADIGGAADNPRLIELAIEHGFEAINVGPNLHLHLRTVQD